MGTYGEVNMVKGSPSIPVHFDRWSRILDADALHSDSRGPTKTEDGGLCYVVFSLLSYAHIVERLVRCLRWLNSVQASMPTLDTPKINTKPLLGMNQPSLRLVIPIFQMGPIYLFAGSISEELLRGVRKLGPGYAYSFEPPQVDSREVSLLPTPDPHLQALSELDTDVPGASAANLGEAKGDGGSRRAETPAEAAAMAARQHAHLAALGGSLTPLILLAYNPGVWGGEYFLDNTPECNPVRWTNGSPASSSTRKQWEPDGASRARAIYSMAGSQTHVLIQPLHPSTHRGASGSTGSIDGAQARSDGRDSSGHRPNAARRTRAWSGWSGYSEEDSVLGGEEGKSVPSVRPRPRPGYMHAMRLPGTRECVTRDVRDALDCLGGVKVLLPLFAQYDHGVLHAGRVSYRTDPRLNETVLALLAGTLRDRCVRMFDSCVF